MSFNKHLNRLKTSLLMASGATAKTELLSNVKANLDLSSATIAASSAQSALNDAINASDAANTAVSHSKKSVDSIQYLTYVPKELADRSAKIFRESLEDSKKRQKRAALAMLESIATNTDAQSVLSKAETAYTQFKDTPYQSDFFQPLTSLSEIGNKCLTVVLAPVALSLLAAVQLIEFVVYGLQSLIAGTFEFEKPKEALINSFQSIFFAVVSPFINTADVTGSLINSGFNNS